MANALGDANFVGFDIQITTDEIQTALEQVAPPEWVVAQADNVIDTLVAYLTGESDSLSITVDLADRKGDAVQALSTLAETKLRDTISSLPNCQTPTDLAQAAAAISAGQVPQCAPSGAEAAVPLMMPYINSQIEQLIQDQMPDSFVYSDAQFRSTLGEDQVSTLDDARDLITNGITFTDQDLVDALAGGGDQQTPEDVQNFQDTLDQIRTGFSFTDADLQAKMGDNFDQVAQNRDRIGLALSLRYLLYVLPFALLAIVAFVGGRGWRGRGMWAGMTLFVVSVILLLTFVIGASQGRSRVEPLIQDQIDISDGMRQDFPTLAALLESDRVPELGFDALDSFVSAYRNGIIPFVIVGGVLFLVAAAYPKFGTSMPGNKRPGGAPAESAESTGSEQQPTDSV